jgi:adenine-specific DNA glycosylase
LAGIDRLGSFTHVLSHRRIHVHVFRGDAAPGARAVGRSWQSRSNIDSLPVSNAVKRVLEMC